MTHLSDRAGDEKLAQDIEELGLTVGLETREDTSRADNSGRPRRSSSGSR
jgi:hypothetical protein